MSVQILQVEGSESAARRFFPRACAQTGIKWLVNRVKDAYEAIDYLSGFQHFAERARFPLPQVILLSLKARTRDGIDLLAWLRGDGRFRELPVVVSTVEATSDQVISAFKLAPEAWFSRADDFREVLRCCEELVTNPWPRIPRAGSVPALSE
jgi:CheY-like chemotaxis protein